MRFSQKIIRAINFAGHCHRGMTRKGKADIEYITHPLGVALILAGIGCDEEVVIAGILHDTVEDSKGKVSLQDIDREFGDRVSRIVDDVTEKDKSLPWDERKKKALEHVPHMQRDSMLVKSADLLYNLKDLVLDLETQGDGVYQKFNAPKEKQHARFKNLVKALADAWPGNPLLAELRGTLKKVIG